MQNTQLIQNHPKKEDNCFCGKDRESKDLKDTILFSYKINYKKKEQKK